MTQLDDLKNLLRRHHRRLQVLKEQQAKFGLHTPAHIIVEIEDTEAEIEALQTEWKAIQDDPHTLAQRTEQQQKRIATGLAEIREQTTGQPPAQQSHVSVVGRPPVGVVEQFKDRVREQEKIGQLLAEPTTRLVSVIGHGGMGKTALASKILRDLEQHRWPHTEEDIPLDGIVYLSTRTAGISLERLFLDCAKLLGGNAEKHLNTVWTTPQLSTDDKIAQLLDALKEGQYVILLDNLEDLLDDKGQLVDEDLRRFFDQSLPQAHGTRLVITSRVAVAFGREVMRYDHQVKLLEGLPIAEGIELLRELDPNGDYGLRDAPKEQLAQVVELVHGVPRALEVIAGILANDPFASLDEVMAQFYKQEDVVTALIEENYKRLDDNARRVIEALAVFRRPVSPLAVDYLLEPFMPGLDGPDIIRRLTHTNIVSVDRATKTIILHPIDQDYAYNQLAQEGMENEFTRRTLERRAADYYAQLYTPPESWKSIDDLGPQLMEFEHRVRAEDYDEACQLLNAIDQDYLHMWGHYTRLIEMRQKLLGRIIDPFLEATNLTQIGEAYRPIGQSEEAIKVNGDALAIARRIGNRKLEAEILGNLANAYHDVNQLERAIELNEQTLVIIREMGDRQMEANRLGRLGWDHLSLSQCEQAIALFDEALIIAREVGDRRTEEKCLGSKGLACYRLGRLEQALKLQQDAMVIARVIGDRQGIGGQLGRQGLIYHKLGQYEQAIQLYQRAIASVREITNFPNEILWLSLLGNVYYTLNQNTQAIELYEEALSIERKIKYRRGRSFLLLGLGRVMLASGKLVDAQQYCAEAVDLGVQNTSFEARLILGIVLLHQGNPESKEVFTTTVMRCNAILDKTARLFQPHYVLATALAGKAVCDNNWGKKPSRLGLLAPATIEYQYALDVCDAPGVVQDALRDLELIRSAGVEGLEPAFELLEVALPKNGVK